MKDAYSPEVRAAYNRAYRNKYKAPKVDLIGPPRPKKCECGELGMHKMGSEWTCTACKTLEGIDWHSNQINEDLAIQRNITPAHMLRAFYLFYEEFCAWLEDKGNELVIHGHGEYHLQLT